MRPVGEMLKEGGLIPWVTVRELIQFVGGTYPGASGIGGHRRVRPTRRVRSGTCAYPLECGISDAIAGPVRHVDVTPEQKRQEWLDAGYPAVRADAFLQLFNERRALGHSDVYLATHEKFGIEPTTFARFAVHRAAVFSGRATYDQTPA